MTNEESNTYYVNVKTYKPVITSTSLHMFYLFEDRSGLAIRCPAKCHEVDILVSHVSTHFNEGAYRRSDVFQYRGDHLMSMSEVPYEFI